MRDFHRELDIGHAKIKNFVGAISKEFSHYVKPTLEDSNLNAASLHLGVKHLLQNRN